jgi:hypothetical protein
MAKVIFFVRNRSAPSPDVDKFGVSGGQFDKDADESLQCQFLYVSRRGKKKREKGLTVLVEKDGGKQIRSFVDFHRRRQTTITVVDHLLGCAWRFFSILGLGT